MALTATRAGPRTPAPEGALAGVPVVPLAVVVITAAAFALRLSQVHQSLFGDEIYTYRDVAGRSLGAMLHAIRPPDENAPPLFFVLAWLSAKLGNPSVWIRLPSLILSTATIPLVYLVGRETVGRTAGLIGAALLAVSPFTVYYAIEARPYASVAFFVTLATLAVLRAVRTGRPGWWLAYVLSAASAAYSHYTGIFAIGVLTAWSLWACRGHIRAPALAGAAVVALYVPWLPHLRSKDLAVIGGLEPLTLHNIGVDLLRVSVGYPYAGLSAIPTTPGVIAIGLCGLLGLIFLARARRTGRVGLFGADRGGAALIVALALATPVGVLLYSSVSTDIWDARDLYASAPAAALVLGALLASVGGWGGRARILATAVTVAILLVGTIRAIGPTYARPPFRDAADYLDRVAGPHDPIIMYPSFLALDGAIPAQLQRPHLLITTVPARWPAPPAGGDDFAILDDSAARALHIRTPEPAGLELVARRHYAGLVSFSVLSYRRRGG